MDSSYVHVHLHIHTTHVRTCMSMYIHTDICPHLCMQVYTHIDTCIPLIPQIHTRVHTHVYTLVHRLYTHKYEVTYRQTNKQTTVTPCAAYAHRRLNIICTYLCISTHVQVYPDVYVCELTKLASWSVVTRETEALSPRHVGGACVDAHSFAVTTHLTLAFI